MQKCNEMLKRLGRDEEGTALIEYAILLGVVATAAIGAAIAIGGWTSGKWTAFCGALPGAVSC